MAKYKLKKGFITQRFGDKITIFEGEKSLLYILNETASYIFSKLKSGWSNSKIIVSMVRKYKIGAETAKKDVGEFISDLKKKRILSAGKPRKQSRELED